MYKFGSVLWKLKSFTFTTFFLKCVVIIETVYIRMGWILSSNFIVSNTSVIFKDVKKFCQGKLFNEEEAVTCQ